MKLLLRLAGSPMRNSLILTWARLRTFSAVRSECFTASGVKHSERTAEKVRNLAQVRINEFRIGDPANLSNSFIELYNGGAETVDISGWSLTEHQTQQAVFSEVTIPAGTRLASKGFYLLGLANSGLAAPAKAGDGTIYVRSVAGM